MFFKCFNPLTAQSLILPTAFWDQEIVKLGTIGGRSYLVNAKTAHGIWHRPAFTTTIKFLKITV